MEIRIIDSTENNVIEDVVNLHIEAFENFFLTFMGKGFLKQLYISYCRHTESELLGAFDNSGKLLGFAAFSGDYSGLYKYMIKTRLIPFAWFSLGAFFRKPGVFMRLIRAFLKPGEAERNEKYIELASIAVSPNSESKGIGSGLIDEVKAMTDFSKYKYITLETDALNNEKANAFYVKNGFKLERTYETHEGRKMNEYRFGGNEI